MLFRSGPAGPYLQSQRMEIYEKYIKKLLDEKKAYYCFETPEELTAMRQKAAREKTNFLYTAPKIFPTDDDVEKARLQGKPVVVRFVMPREEIIVEDIIRGSVKFPPS